MPVRIVTHRNPLKPWQAEIESRAVACTGSSIGAVLGAGVPDSAHLRINGRRAGRDAWVYTGDIVNVLHVPGDPFTLAAGIYQSAAAVVGGLQSAFGTFQQLQGTIGSIAYGAFTLRLGPFAPSKLRTPRIPRSDASQIYGWSGLFTEYNPAGLPIPVLMGEHRLPGYVISRHIEVIDGDKPESYLYLLVLLGAGPFQSIGQYETDQDDLTADSLPTGMLVDGNAAGNFDNITVSLRLGTLGQEVMPGFTAIPSLYAVGLEASQGDGSVNDPVVTDWTTYGVSFTMPLGSEAERGDLVLHFPDGLWKINAAGAFKPHSVSFRIRYTKVNDAGDKVGSSVILPSATTSYTHTAKALTAFDKSISFPFFDPETFTEPLFYDAVSYAAGTKRYSILESTSTALLNAIPGFAAGAPVDELSIFHVFRIDSTAADTVHNPICAWGKNSVGVATSPALVEGVYLFALKVPGEPTTSQLNCWWGNSPVSSAATSTIAGGEIEEDTVYSVAFTFKRNASGSQHRVRLYLNGGMVAEKLTTIGMDIPSSPVAGSSNGNPSVNVFPGGDTSGTGQWHGNQTHDQLRIFGRELSPSELPALHNGGAFTFSETDVDPDLLLAVLPTLPPTFASAYIPIGSLAATWDYYQNGGEVSPVSFLVSPGFTSQADQNTVSKGRYVVELERTSAYDDTDKKKSRITFAHLTTWLDQEIAYAGCALAGVRILATDQLQSSRPDISWLCKGWNDLPIWDGLSATAPTFAPGYSQNPAWHAAKLILDKTEGAGHLYGVENIDWAAAKVWADENDTLVYDQLGKLPASEIDYDANVAGDRRVLVTVAKPRLDSFVVGATVRVHRRNPALYVIPSGAMEIKSIDESDSVVDVLSLGWPGGDISNLLASPNNLTAFGWGTTGTAPVITDNAYAAAFAEFAPFAEIGTRVTYQGGGQSQHSRTVAGLDSGELHRLSCYVLILDGIIAGGTRRDWTARFDLGTENASVVVEDLGQVDSTGRPIPVRVSVTLVANSASEAFRFGNVSDPDDRDVVVWGFMVSSGEDLLDFDETPNAGPWPQAAQQLIGPANDLDDEDVWVPSGAIPPVLIQAQADGPGLPYDLLSGDPGYSQKMGFGGRKASVFEFPAVADGTSWLQWDSGSARSGTHRPSIYARVVDEAGSWVLRFDVGGTDTGTLTVPDDGAWHRVSTTVTGGGSQLVSIESRDTGSSGARRRIALAGVMLQPSSVATLLEPFQGGQVAEAMGVEPLCQSDIVLADRGKGFWATLIQICSIGRAVPVRYGDLISFRMLREREPTFLLGPANMEIGSFVASASNDAGRRPNSAVAEFQDRAIDFERNTVKLDSEELDDVTSTASVRRETYNMVGVTRASQVMRELRVTLNTARYIKRGCELVAGPDAAFIAMGEVGVICHPVPLWSDGAKVYERATVETEFKTDAPIVISQRNVLEWSRDLSRSENQASFTGQPWRLEGTTVQPTVDGTAVSDPNGDPFGWAVTFPPSAGATNPRIRQRVPHRGSGAVYTASCWMRLTQDVTGKQLQIRVKTDPEFTLIIDVTGALVLDSWVKVYGQATSADSASQDVDWQVQRLDAESGDVIVEIAWPRLHTGPNDDHPGSGEELTGAFPDVYACVRDTRTDELHFVRSVYRAGAFATGETIRLQEALPYLPEPGDLFVIGALTSAARTFEAVEGELEEGFRRRLRLVEYDARVFPDWDEFPPLSESLQNELLLGQETVLAEKVLPDPVLELRLAEEPVLDTDTGRLDKGLLVTWRLDPATAYHVARVHVWLRDVTDGDPWELVATVGPREGGCKVSGGRGRLERGHRYEVAVQPETATGVRRGLQYARTAQAPYQGYFPSPAAPGAGEIRTVGEMVSYRLTGPDYASAETGQDIDFVRGPLVLGMPIARVPIGDRGTAPGYDFVDLPANSIGRANPVVSVRLVTRDGSVGEVLEIDGDTLDLSAWPARVLGSSYEDGDWSTVGTLTNLSEETDPLTGLQRLTWGASVELTGTYTGPIHDLGGRALRYHIGAALEGTHWHPMTPNDLDQRAFAGSRRTDWWTAQGPADARDPDYAPLGVAFEIRTSETSSPSAASWRPYRPGVFWCRSFQLRVVFTRPDTTHDVKLTRMAVGVRTLPLADAVRIVQPGLLT